MIHAALEGVPVRAALVMLFFGVTLLRAERDLPQLPAPEAVMGNSPKGHWQDINPPMQPLRAGNDLLSPPAVAQANTRDGLGIQPPPQGSAPAQTGAPISSRP